MPGRDGTVPSPAQRRSFDGSPADGTFVPSPRFGCRYSDSSEPRFPGGVSVRRILCQIFCKLMATWYALSTICHRELGSAQLQDELLDPVVAHVRFDLCEPALVLVEHRQIRLYNLAQDTHVSRVPA